MKVGIIGFGAIGNYIAKELKKEGIAIAWVIEKDARKRKKGLRFVSKPNYKVDLVVEAAAQAAVAEFIPAALRKTNAMVMSVGALADDRLRRKIESTAKKHNTQLFLPSGAIAGLDAIKSSKKFLREVVLETRKNPKGFGRKDKREKVLFNGTARKAVKLFPQNINVAATLSLAGIGFDKTRVKIISDPKIRGNQHTIFAKGKSGKMLFNVENVPSPDNPKTSFLAALAAVRTVKEMQEKIVIS